MRRKAATGERGQALAILVVALVALLGISALAIDLGYAWYAKHQLQGATDAAALAGAQDLPNASTAISSANSYATLNTPANLPSTSYTVASKCTTTASYYCTGGVQNAITVDATTSVPTFFSRIFGINSLTLHAKSTACQPCATAPFDIVVVLDRTGSMCQPLGPGNTCTDLNNAKDGIRALLQTMEPPLDAVGLVAFPPIPSGNSICSAPATKYGTDYYDYSNGQYIDDHLSTDYGGGGTLNTSSSLYQHTVDGTATACIENGGNTSYQEALRQGYNELLANGRPNVPKILIFMTDGEANIGPVWGPATIYPYNGYQDTNPCQSAINQASTIKAAGVTIYTIGYDISSSVVCTRGGFKNKNTGAACTPTFPITGSSTCLHVASFANESPSITGSSAVQSIASPGDYYQKATAGDVTGIFQAIAADITAGTSRLVPDNY